MLYKHINIRIITTENISINNNEGSQIDTLGQDTSTSAL